jgi:L-rhamnose mutarotase
VSECVGHVWRIRPGRVAEYDERHARVWPELEELMRRAGVSSYSIYRWREIVFSHMEVDDYERLVDLYAGDPVAERWEAEFAELLEFPNADPASGWPERLHHVWSLERR